MRSQIIARLVAPFVAVVGLVCTSYAIGTAQPPSQTSNSSTGPVTVQVDPYARFELHPRAFDFYVGGLMASGLMEYGEAVQLYRQALQIEPNSYEIRYSLAESYYYLRQPSLSLDVLAEIYPVSIDVYLLSGFCYRMLGDNDATKRVYLKTLELDKENAVALSYLASLYQQENDLDSTLWAYEALAKGPGSSDARIWNDLARLRLQKGMVDSAKTAYRTSMALDNSAANQVAVAGYGEILLHQGQTDSAMALFEEELKRDTNNVYFHNQLMAYYARSDSFALALPHARKVSELAPLDREASRRLAIIYISMDSVRHADSIFSALVASGDNTPINHFYLGAVAMMQEQFGRARDEYLLLTSMQDTSAIAWLNLGSAYRELGDTAREMISYREGLRKTAGAMDQNRLRHAVAGFYERTEQRDQAIVEYQAILEQNPEDFLAMNNLGYIYADRGEQLEYARELIAKAVQSDPKNAAFLDSYGWVYYKLGDYDQAVEYLKQAVATASDPTLFEHLGDAYRAKGDTDMARQWYQKALELNPSNLALQEKLTH